MLEVNTLVLADEVCSLSSPGYGHCLVSPGSGHCFELVGQGHGSSRVCEVKDEEVLSFFCIYNDFSVLHQGYCSGVIMVSDPHFSVLTK